MSLNPWALAILFALGGIVGGGTAWNIQEGRLDKLHSEFHTFVAKTQKLGEEAQKRAEEKDAQNQLAKETADNEYQTRFNALNADIERLRKSRTSSSIVPKASATTKRPDLACFDRAEFISAIQRLDDAVFKLVNQGDERALEIGIAKEWANSIKSKP